MLKTFEDHQNKRIHEISNGEGLGPEFVYNGIACPDCGSELLDVYPDITLMSSPPQYRIECSDCSYKGYRL